MKSLINGQPLPLMKRESLILADTKTFANEYFNYVYLNGVLIGSINFKQDKTNFNFISVSDFLFPDLSAKTEKDIKFLIELHTNGIFN